MPESGDWVDDQGRRVDELIDEYRVALHDSLNGLTEEEARRRLVPSKTTLLGLVKHATFVEGVWFDQAVTGRSYSDIGIAGTVEGSFTLRRTDTVASVQTAFRDRWEATRRNLGGRHNDEVVDGRGPRPLWALKLQVLRELAQHAGHADILPRTSHLEPLRRNVGHKILTVEAAAPTTPRRSGAVTDRMIRRVDRLRRAPIPGNRSPPNWARYVPKTLLGAFCDR